MNAALRLPALTLPLLVLLALAACGGRGPSADSAADDSGTGTESHEGEHDEDGPEVGEAVALSPEAVAAAGIVTAPAGATAACRARDHRRGGLRPAALRPREPPRRRPGGIRPRRAR